MSVAAALSGFHKSYRARLGSTAVLRDVNFEARSGEFVAIVGASGSGKTTLFRALAGLDLPDSGRVTLLGEDLGTLTPRARAALRGARIGIIAQEPTLLMDATVLRNVALPLSYAGTVPSSRPARALSALRSVRLEGLASQRCRDLTKDQRQRVQIARALVTGPELIVADEPFAALTRESKNLVCSLFADQRGAGRTLIVIDQDLLATELADSCYLLEDKILAVHPLMGEREAVVEKEDVDDPYQMLLEAEEEAKTIFAYPIDWTLAADELGIPIVFSIDEALAGNFVKEGWWRR
ncbi:MAG: ATP-binding cassette domain-containing protein [Coriobacteriales bacterium]|jgi:ABC-type lipoprotein export system ATPase subunit|nr:ATP-binding cassette domain-containing protein [Coriobacteriales bacterium]